MPTYAYITIQLSEVTAQLQVILDAPADAYTSADLAADKLAEILAAGFRWVRTDGGWAIFEKVTTP